MGVFVSLFLLSALNVGLGYALAVLLGYGPPRLRDAWLALGSDARSTNRPTPMADELLARPGETPGRPAPPASAAALNPPDGDSLAMAEYGGGAT